MMTRRAFLAATGAAVVACRQSASAMSAAPVLIPDQPWEGRCAMPFSGGVWRGATAYQCWYLADFQRVCLAFSDDGLHWEKPNLGIVPGTNIVLQPTEPVDAACVWPNPRGGWVMTLSTPSGGPLRVLTSDDGVRWNSLGTVGLAGDRTSLFYNHITERWVYAVRAGMGLASNPRRIDRVVSETLMPTSWQPEPWLRADREDGASEAAGGAHQLYAVDMIPDGPRLIGLFTIYRGQQAQRPKLNDVCLGISTDGETFTRRYQPILTRSEIPQAWNYGNVQGVTGGLIKTATGYRFYASGRSGVPNADGNGVCAMGYREVRSL